MRNPRRVPGREVGGWGKYPWGLPGEGDSRGEEWDGRDERTVGGHPATDKGHGTFKSPGPRRLPSASHVDDTRPVRVLRQTWWRRLSLCTDTRLVSGRQGIPELDSGVSVHTGGKRPLVGHHPSRPTSGPTPRLGVLS